MSRRAIARHELLHACGFATYLADRSPPRVYRSAKLFMYIADGEGRCALDTPEDAALDRNDLAACAALAPAALAPRPMMLLRASPELQRSAGLSDRDISYLRKWRGQIAPLERLVAATTELAKALPLERMIDVLLTCVDPSTRSIST